MNNIVIIGSTALRHWYSDARKPKDLDCICKKEFLKNCTFEGYKNLDIKEDRAIVTYDHIPPIEYLFNNDVKSLELIQEQLCLNTIHAPIEILYSLKMAHIHYPIKFNKHIQDIQFMREKLRQKKKIDLEVDLNSVDDLLDTYPALTHLHKIETEKRLGKLKIPKMDNTTEEFFGKSKKFVKSYYTHDNMHKAMAHMTLIKQNGEEAGLPAYETILKDNSEVETDIEYWKELSLSEKIYCVLEEVYVIALERKILPQMFGDYPKDRIEFTDEGAFDWALMRVCTTLCDGFFRDFAVKAYDVIQEQYDPNYVQKFFKNINKYEK